MGRKGFAAGGGGSGGLLSVLPAPYTPKWVAGLLLLALLIVTVLLTVLPRPPGGSGGKRTATATANPGALARVQHAATAEPGPYLQLATPLGTIRIRLLVSVAPRTCDTIARLVMAGHYRDCVVYRAEPGFVIQGGLRRADGSPSPTPFGGIPLEAKLSNKQGYVGLARWAEPSSGTGEWFINLADNHHLDRSGDSGWQLGFTVFGEVVSGMDVAEAISLMPTDNTGGMRMLRSPVPFNASILDFLPPPPPAWAHTLWRRAPAKK